MLHDVIFVTDARVPTRASILRNEFLEAPMTLPMSRTAAARCLNAVGLNAVGLNAAG